PAEAVDLAPLALGGAPGTAVALCDDRDGFAWGSALLVGRGRHGCADALGEGLTHDEDAVEAGDPHAHLVARPHQLRRLDLLTVQANMPGAACGRRSRAGLVDADRPQPAVDADGFLAHGRLRRV